MIFISGKGSPKDHTACIMSAARILAGEATEADERNDNCARVCPVVRAFAIGVNDWKGWKSDEERTAYLAPLVPMLLDTQGGDQQKRAFIAADFAVRIAAPIALEVRGYPERAAKLRELTPITNTETARQAASAASDVAYAAAYAASAAYAAAYAANAASAFAAAYAADTGAASSAASYAPTLRDALIDTLKRMCQ